MSRQSRARIGRARERSISFRDYLLTRRYHFGRGSSEGWMFTARALGDPRLLAAASWAELRKQLELQGSDPETLRAAQRVWSSYLAHVAKNRHSVAMSARQLLSDAQAPLAYVERGMNP